MIKKLTVMPYISAGITSAVIMALEMAGIRFITPYFGNSLNTWAVVISIILASLGIGYGIGGKWARARTIVTQESILLLIAGLYIGVATFFKYQLMAGILSLPQLGLFGDSIIASILFFAVPNICLAALAPLFAASVVITVSQVGRSIALLNMASTVGSIIGTLVTPLFLVPALGTTTTLFCIASTCIVWSIVLNRTRKKMIIFLLLPLFVAAVMFHRSFEHYLLRNGYGIWDTAYATNLIYQDRQTTFLITGIFGYESSSTRGQKNKPYLPHFDEIIDVAVSSPRSALVLGSGTLSISSFLSATYPSLHVTSVDIDGTLADIAQKYFHFVPSKAHTLIENDGRVVLNSAKRGTFDLVINDAYKDVSPPFQLTTKEAAERLYDVLTPNGVAITNVPAAAEGKASWLLQSSYATLRSVFPYVYIVPLEKSVKPDLIQSMILVALKRQDPSIEASILKRGGYKQSFQPRLVMTDDKAPVEYNLLSVTTGNSAYNWSRYFVRQVDALMRAYVDSML
jgi:predicted membrane-bound spermidine synthase